MAQKLERLPDEVFEFYTNLRAGGGLNQTQIGKQLITRYPALFEGMMAKSVVVRVCGQAGEYGIELPQGRVGGVCIPEPDSRWVDQTPELVVPFCDKVLIMSDVHAGAMPYGTSR